MCTTNALRIALIALSVSAAGQVNVHAGSYTWAGGGGAGVSLVDWDPDTGNPIFTAIPPPTSILVQISYDPTSAYYSSSQTSGYVTTYDVSQSDFFSFLITGKGSPDWVGFYGFLPDFLSITAPPPGGGLDAIEFGAFQPNVDSDNRGYVAIYAPNGTLSTSTQLPSSLTAFQSYGRNHEYAGYFEFDGSSAGGGAPYYYGWAYGVMGASVPEPSTLALLSISMSLVAGTAAFRRRNPGKVLRSSAAEAASGSPRQG